MTRTAPTGAHFPALLAVLGALGSACSRGSASPTAAITPSPPAEVMVSADLPEAPSPPGAGLYQDGQGTYLPGMVFVNPRGNLFVVPQCGRREANLVLPQTSSDVVTGRLSRCTTAGEGPAVLETIWLHLPGFLGAQPGAVVGLGGAPPNSDTSVSVFLLLNADANGDGDIRLPPDEQYNVRWQKGIYLKQRSETATTTVYELTSLATQFGPDLSCSAELILRNTPLGEISKGFHCLPLVLTVTLQK